MRKNIIHVAIAVVAAGVLSTLGVSGAGASGAATRAGQPAMHSAATVRGAAAVSGAQLWIKRYNGPANGSDGGQSVAVSPSGGTVFVTGNSYGATSGSDYATIAYNATTGKQLWVRRYIGTGGDNDGTAVAVSPSGDRVFVTGDSWRATSDFDYITIAYSS